MNCIFVIRKWVYVFRVMNAMNSEKKNKNLYTQDIFLALFGYILLHLYTCYELLPEPMVTNDE